MTWLQASRAGRALSLVGVPLGTLVVGITGVASELAVTPYPYPDAIGAYLAAVLTAAALVARARWLFPATIAILLICLGYHLLGYPGQAPAIALFVVLFLIPSRGRLAWSLPVAIGVAALWSVIPALPPHSTLWLDSAVLGPALGMAIIAMTGTIPRVSAERLAAEHAAKTAETRAEIARDIHDVLAHTITAITVQANLALDAVDDDPQLAKTAIRRARDLARAATPQLRHSLLQLRDNGRPEQPQPTLELVNRVLDEARAGGFEVRQTIDLPTGRLDPVAELTVARIVQEAVTNAVRHSGGTRLDCNISLRGGELTVQIADNGSREPGPEGLGIAGMRERAAAVGGTVDIALEPATHRVTASIPLPDQSTRT